MLRPAALRSDEKLLWSPGRGTDLWALIQACISGDLDAVRALIARDPSLARAHYTYRKPLYFAVRENRVDIARFLLEHDHNPMDLWFDDSPLEIARDRGYVEMERLLTETLDTKFNASSKGEPIALALREHDLTRMRELLDAEPALLSKGDLPIQSADPLGDDDAAARGDRRAAATRRRHQCPAHGRRAADSSDQRRLFLSRLARRPARLADDGGAGDGAPAARGAIVDLPTACHTGDLDRVRELLRQDPSLANRLGGYEGYYLGAGAPLANAAAVGRLDIVQLLLDHGADPNLPEEQIAPRGKALYEAVMHRHYEIAKLLLERGAFPNPPVESSGDALWVAREFRPDARMEQLLLSYGATPTPEDPTRRGRKARTTGCASRRSTSGRAGRRPREGEGAARRGRRSDRARRAPSVDAAGVGGEVRSTRDGQVAARARCAEESAGRSGVGDAARLGEEARARRDRETTG